MPPSVLKMQTPILCQSSSTHDWTPSSLACQLASHWLRSPLVRAVYSPILPQKKPFLKYRHHLPWLSYHWVYWCTFTADQLLLPLLKIIGILLLVSGLWVREVEQILNINSLFPNIPSRLPYMQHQYVQGHYTNKITILWNIAVVKHTWGIEERKKDRLLSRVDCLDLNLASCSIWGEFCLFKVTSLVRFSKYVLPSDTI